MVCLTRPMKRSPKSATVFEMSAAGSSQTEFFLGSCDRDRVDRYITIFITGDDALHVAIHYGVPSYCLLDLLE